MVDRLSSPIGKDYTEPPFAGIGAAAIIRLHKIHGRPEVDAHAVDKGRRISSTQATRSHRVCDRTDRDGAICQRVFRRHSDRISGGYRAVQRGIQPGPDLV